MARKTTTTIGPPPVNNMALAPGPVQLNFGHDQLEQFVRRYVQVRYFDVNRRYAENAPELIRDARVCRLPREVLVNIRKFERNKVSASDAVHTDPLDVGPTNY